MFNNLCAIATFSNLLACEYIFTGIIMHNSCKRFMLVGCFYWWLQSSSNDE